MAELEREKSTLAQDVDKLKYALPSLFILLSPFSGHDLLTLYSSHRDAAAEITLDNLRITDPVS
jgi:hypothetical protein